MPKLEVGGERTRTKEMACQEFASYCGVQLEQVLAKPSENWMSEEDALERIRLKIEQAKQEFGQ